MSKQTLSKRAIWNYNCRRDRCFFVTKHKDKARRIVNHLRGRKADVKVIENKNRICVVLYC